METFKQRLKRYTSQDDLEIFGWLKIYLQNQYLSELRVARKARLYFCVYLVTHSIIQMISENLFGLTGKEGTKFYLAHFVDGTLENQQFSLIADEIHAARNVMAHQGYSSLQHGVEYFDDAISVGWMRQDTTVHINPVVYAQRFEAAITSGAWMQEYLQQSAATRLLRKYRYIRQWLQLAKGNPIAAEIRKLEAHTDLADMRAQEAVVQALIYQAYEIADNQDVAG